VLACWSADVLGDAVMAPPGVGIEVWWRARADRDAVPVALGAPQALSTESARPPATHEEARALKDRLEAECSLLAGRIREAQARAARTGEYMPRDEYNALLALRDQRKREVAAAHGILAQFKRTAAVEARAVHREKERLFVDVARERLPADVFAALMAEATTRWLEADDDERR